MQVLEVSSNSSIVNPARVHSEFGNIAYIKHTKCLAKVHGRI
jgi:hypothetical protein